MAMSIYTKSVQKEVIQLSLLQLFTHPVELVFLIHSLMLRGNFKSTAEGNSSIASVIEKNFPRLYTLHGIIKSLEFLALEVEAPVFCS